MFRHFSFEAASRPPSVADAEHTQMSVSPTSHSMAVAAAPYSTASPCSMGDLATKLHHDLRVQVDPAYELPCCEPPTPPSDSDSFAFQRSYSRLTTATLRMQRQAHTRMQCRPSHVRDISLLVQKMIEDEDQCHVCESKTQPPSPTTSDDSDEGVDMDYTPPTPEDYSLFKLNFRRSGDRLAGCTLVSRSVRMRKKSRVTKPSSK